jgi:heme exporter protein A
MNALAPTFEAIGLSAQKGEQWLFENIGFTLHAGTWLQVQGDNGSGKTTLLRMLAGLSRSPTGEVRWCNNNIRDEPEGFHRALMYLGHQLGLKEELSALENLGVASHMAQQTLHTPRALAALGGLGLEGREHLPLRVLSQGQKRRVALAKLMSLTSCLWILDEPFVALDGQGLSVFLAAMQAHLGQGGMLIYTSHQSVDLGCIPGWALRLTA